MIKTIDQYIADGEIDQACEVIIRGLIGSFNIYCPGLSLTKENLAVLAEPLKKKFLGEEINPPKDPAEKYKKTAAPGDDINIMPARAQLTIVYKCDDEKVNVPGPITEMVTVGQDYYYDSPEIEGYSATPSVVNGKMTTAGATITVIYDKIKTSDEEEEEKKDKFGKVKIITDDFKCCCKEDCSHEKCCTVTGDGGSHVVATVTNEMLLYKKAGEDGSHSLTDDGWWAGIEIAKPTENQPEAKDFGTVRVYNYDGTYSEFKVDAKKNPKITDAFNVYTLVLPERLEVPNGSDGMLTCTVRIDWNADGIFEQQIDFKLDPATVVLKMNEKDTQPVWPKRK